MATVGSSPSDPDHTECSVCLESMLTKDPRLLICGHSFCTPCIKKLTAKDAILCPKCREETKLPTGGTEELPKFDKESIGYCGLCSRHNKHIKATHTCDKCPNQRICGSCTEKHSIFGPLISHRVQRIKVEKSEPDISEICQDHCQTLEYFCPECQIPLCLDCMFSGKHVGHENRITEIDCGISGIKSMIEFYSKELEVKEIGLKRKIAYVEKRSA